MMYTATLEINEQLTDDQMSIEIFLMYLILLKCKYVNISTNKSEEKNLLNVSVKTEK